VDSLAHRRLLLPVLGGLVAVAWLSLWIWDRSPYGRYLNHAEMGSLGLGGDGLPVLLQSALYVAGWTLMTVAMMLPTTLPLLEAFQRMVAARRDRAVLLASVIGGYLGVWLVFGVLAHAFDYGLHRAVDRSGWLQANSWVFGAGPLLLAGAFQFSSLKYRCLDKCRAPVTFVVQHWRGGHPQRQALMIGAHHGMFCVGCCWALMLLMFAVGTGSLGWMLLLGAAMAIEKNAPWGRRFSAPLGATLIAWGALIVLNHALTWQGR
jgi:predicted metal-binding membrane protein